jgi:hypothetical protein
MHPLKAAQDLFAIDVILLDDGFQHLALHRDVNILLADAARPFGNGRTLPRGTLREPADQIRRADALVLTRALPHSAAPTMWPLGRPVFRAWHRPVGLLEQKFLKAPGGIAETRPMLPLSMLKGKRIAAFSGIADNKGFLDTLTGLGSRIALWRGFGEALLLADLAIITDVYAAGEDPLPGVNGKLIVNALLDADPAKQVVYIPRRSQLGSAAASFLRAGDLVLTMGAGDITQCAAEIAAILDRDSEGACGTGES